MSLGNQPAETPRWAAMRDDRALEDAQETIGDPGATSGPTRKSSASGRDELARTDDPVWIDARRSEPRALAKSAAPNFKKDQSETG